VKGENMKKICLVSLTILSLVKMTLLAQEEFKPTIDFKGSRMAIGYIDSQSDGSFPIGSFQVPDGKIRFNLNMSPDITFVARMPFNNTTVSGFDYFYMDYKNFLSNISPSFKDSLFNPVLRLGRMKLDIGEETWSDNSVEAIVISNSAGLTNGYDEGVQLHQTLKKEQIGIPLKWSLSLTNGNSGTGADNTQSKALCFKIGANPIKELYISGSYYDSGKLISISTSAPADADAAYAGLKTKPQGATEWKRKIMEVDLRYDFKPQKEDRLNPGAPAFSDSKAYLRGAYGEFRDTGKDTITLANIPDRTGSYYFVEGAYNLTEKVYLGARYSKIKFYGNYFDTLNSVSKVNSYERTSLGVGYRFTQNTHMKLEYLRNWEKMKTGSVAPKNDQVAFLITTKF